MENNIVAQDTYDVLKYNQRVTRLISQLLKTSNRLAMAKNSGKCEEAWNEWNDIEDILKPLAELSASVEHYKNLSFIYDELTNVCGPSEN